ncbi:aldehyde dehydrogenase family protein [Alienimonas californiensis]|uniref:NADP-dependent fatty aldehyde dehydrogenase n=1 Tax=Alienimonas californiensis TaxID=2527989 RepID=A0A517PBX8_9PLAN|nr:aldehyde dehydrogenase family protein [Alienimonas californiensis]QDT16859.1 NADP-dependent fatty aldehyde dehydrogenase [Alienimonas californiensis]
MPPADAEGFHADNPATGEPLPERYPVADWAELDRLAAGAAAAFESGADTAAVAAFLEGYADRIEANAADLAAVAALETGLPEEGRLRNGEVPRTVGQLRQAAAAVRDGGWRRPTISDGNIRSILEPLGPTVVIGPNNFPFAFNGACGGDFAAAIGAGCPVIAKGHPHHPGTSRKLAELMTDAAAAAGLPEGWVSLFYDCAPEDGLKLARDPRIAAVAFTGSKRAGLALKAACDETATVGHFELGSENPVFILPGALAERADAIVEELAGSALLGGGQFCTQPGIVVLPGGQAAATFPAALQARFDDAPTPPLLSENVVKGLQAGVKTLTDAGAERLPAKGPEAQPGFRFPNTVLTATAEQFLADPDLFQTECFGPVSLLVTGTNAEQRRALASELQGQLTVTILSDTGGSDDEEYGPLAAILRRKCGRLLNDKMPTGVAVVPAMCHGGPFPASGQPHFTAVGIPAALTRFTRLACYDNVRPERLPAALRD